MMKYYIPKALEDIKTDTILNTNLFLNVVQKELKKKEIKEPEKPIFNWTNIFGLSGVVLPKLFTGTNLTEKAKKHGTPI